MEIKTFSPTKLKEVVTEVLLSLKVRREVVREVTSCLLETSLRGIDSHGIRLLPHYFRSVKAGRINPDPRYAIQRTGPSTAVMDADNTFGHWSASVAMDHCITMAKEAGAGFVSVRRSTHFSACAYYSMKAARQDMIGIAATNTSPIMIPTRGRQAALGTNPISFAFPCAGEDAICVDMATTQVTWNYVQSAKQEKRRIEPNLAVDQHMKSTENPGEVVALLPMGKHKGYALAFVVDVLCSLLGDAPFGPHITEMFKDLSQKRNLAHFVGAINIEKFLEVGRFKQRVAELVETLRKIPPVDPSLPVLVPGDPEKQLAKIRLARGIPLSEEVVRSINEIIVEQNLPSALMLE